LGFYKPARALARREGELTPWPLKASQSGLMGLRLDSLRLSAEEPTPAELARDSPGAHEARDTPSHFRAGPPGARADL